MKHHKHNYFNSNVQQHILQCLKLTNFRVFGRSSFDFHPSFNIIVGKNGSGKTSILESVAYLGLGKSFRKSKAQHIALHGTKEWVIYAECINSSNETIKKLGWKWAHNESTHCQINHEKQARIADFLVHTPVQVINHENYHLIESGPQFKREFIHWLLFHTELEFYTVWVKYQHILKQRNAALKTKSLYHIWDEALLIQADKIHELCVVAVDKLEKYAQELWKTYGCFGKLSIQYKKGWLEKHQLSEALAASRDSDLLYGITHHGPHRADLKIQIDSMPVKHWLSRGQTKLLFTLLYLAREQYIQQHAQKHSILLVDDITAELDPEFRKTLITAFVSMQPMQVFVTTQLSTQVEDTMCNISDYSVISL